MSLPDPVNIVLGGFKINAIENTASISIGDNFYQALDSQTKNNFITGQTFGDLNVINLQSIASLIYDTDAVDTTKPTLMSPLGLD